MSDKAVVLAALTAAFNCTVAGMVAENMQRQALGQSMAYVMDDFMAEKEAFEADIATLEKQCAEVNHE